MEGEVLLEQWPQFHYFSYRRPPLKAPPALKIPKKTTSTLPAAAYSSAVATYPLIQYYHGPLQLATIDCTSKQNTSRQIYGERKSGFQVENYNPNDDIVGCQVVLREGERKRRKTTVSKPLCVGEVGRNSPQFSLTTICKTVLEVLVVVSHVI